MESDGAVHPLLTHLEALEDDAADITFDVHTDSNGYRLLVDGVEIDGCSALSELAPIVHAYLVLEVYSRTDYLIAIHGAAVVKDGHCVLFPGPSGAGKSTLAAALVGSGFGYLSDEMVLVTRGGFRIRPLPVCLSLKQPAWPALEPFFPELSKLPVHHRRDGKNVRYLPPGKIWEEPERELVSKTIVFPEYDGGGQNRLAALKPAEALYRLTHAGYDISHSRLNAARVEEMVDWISRQDCYALNFHALSDGVSRIRQLLS